MEDKNNRRRVKWKRKKERRKEEGHSVPRRRFLWRCFRRGKDMAESFTAIAVTASP